MISGNGNAHAARRTFDHALSALDVDDIEVFHLQFGDLTQLLARDRADLCFVWCGGALLDAGRFLQQVGNGRRLRHECERAIFVDRNFGGNNHAHLVRRASVVLFAELHDVDALRAKRRTDGRRGIGFPGWNLQFDDSLDTFCHCNSTPQYRTEWSPDPRRLDFLDLEEIQHDGGFATEEGNKHRHFVAIHVDIADRADELGEGAVDDTLALALGKADSCLWLLRLLSHLLQDGFDLMLLQRDGASARTHKAGDTRGVTHNIPRLVAHNHFDENIAGEDLSLHGTPLALLDFHLFFHRNNHAEDFVPHVHRSDACLEVAFHLIFVARIGVNGIPGWLSLLSLVAALLRLRTGLCRCGCRFPFCFFRRCA